MPATTIHRVRRSRAVLAAVLCAAGLPVAAVVTESGAAAAGPDGTDGVRRQHDRAVREPGRRDDQPGRCRDTGRPGRHQGGDHARRRDGVRAQRSPLQRRHADRHRDQHAGDADPRGRQLGRPRDHAERRDRVRRQRGQWFRPTVPSRRSTPRPTPPGRRSPSPLRPARERSRSRPTAPPRTSPRPTTACTRSPSRPTRWAPRSPSRRSRRTSRSRPTVRSRSWPTSTTTSRRSTS